MIPTAELSEDGKQIVFTHDCTFNAGRVALLPIGPPNEARSTWQAKIEDGVLVSVHPTIRCMTPDCGVNGSWVDCVWHDESQVKQYPMMQ